MENIDRTKEKIRKPRPYWHVDAKWIVALIFIPVLGATMLIFSLYSMTERDNAIKVSGSMIEAMFTRPGQSSEKDLEAVREKIKESPDKAFKPFPGTDIKITEEDLNKSNPEELKRNLFISLAETIYDGNSSINPGSTFKDNFSKLGLMAIFTKAGHSEVAKFLLYAVLISIFLLALLIFFSYDFGRLFSPGLIFILVGLPALLFLTGIQRPSEGAPSGGEMTMQQGISQFVSSVGPHISQIASKNYIFLSLFGILLILVGIVGRLIQKHNAKKIER